MIHRFYLFLDDERFPPQDGKPWNVVRSVKSALNLIRIYQSLPDFISFDHDLGDNEPTGFDLAKKLVEMDLDKVYGGIPKRFDFYVHSQNPVGKDNIEGLLRQYMRHKNET